MKDGDNLPDWVTMWNQGRRFEINTDDSDYAGKYTIQVKAVILDKYFYTVPWEEDTLEIELEIFAKDFTVAEQQGLDLED